MCWFNKIRLQNTYKSTTITSSGIPKPPKWLTKPIFVINIKSLNINVSFCILHKPNSYNSNHLKILWDPICTSLRAICDFLGHHHIIYYVVMLNIFTTKNNSKAGWNSKVEN
nr:hypothetical protein Iba_chr03dCG11550 [Ipomoea batatas]